MNTQKTDKSWKITLYRIIFKTDTPMGKAFDIVLIICILLSVGVVILDSIQTLPAHYHGALYAGEWFFTILFTIEYILRLICVPSKRGYALSFYGVIDLLAILPTYAGLFIRGLGYLKVIRILRVLRIFRILKLGNHIKQAQILQDALYASREKILVFLFSVLVMVVIIGALMYSIESPDNNGFSNIPQSMYWAIVTLTTVGYGDVSPQTPLGKMLASVVMLLGYSIIAVPTGIVTAQMIQISDKSAKFRCPECGHSQHDSNALFCKICGQKLL
jgi:voltage-gated potassium channel